TGTSRCASACGVRRAGSVRDQLSLAVAVATPPVRSTGEDDRRRPAHGGVLECTGLCPSESPYKERRRGPPPLLFVVPGADPYDARPRDAGLQAVSDRLRWLTTRPLLHSIASGMGPPLPSSIRSGARSPICASR